jgi:small subunit ribosomal protein S20
LPKTKTAEKSARSAARKAARNKTIRSSTKTAVTRAETLVAGKDQKEAATAVKEAQSSLDRAAKKGVMHPNTVARKKSRLVKKLNKAAKKA